MAIERSAVVAAIADRLRVSPVAVVLQWTLARGVVVIPRTADPKKIVENISVGATIDVVPAASFAHELVACRES